MTGVPFRNTQPHRPPPNRPKQAFRLTGLSQPCGLWTLHTNMLVLPLHAFLAKLPNARHGTA